MVEELGLRLRALEGRVGATLGGGRRVSNLMFADDVTVLAEDAVTAQEALDVCQDWGTKARVAWNTRKSVWMQLGQDRTAPALTLGGAVLPRVEDTKFLGVTLEASGRWDKEARARLRSMQGALDGMRGAGAIQSRGNVRMMRLVWKTCIAPCGEYGAEVTRLTARQDQHMEAVMNSCMRMILGAPGFTPAECLRWELDLPRVATRRMQRALDWTGRLWVEHETRPESILGRVAAEISDP